MKQVNYFGECTNCDVWSKAPKHFNESKHFMVCPKCDGNMFLSRRNVSEPIPTFWKDSKRVEATKLRPH